MHLLGDFVYDLVWKGGQRWSDYGVDLGVVVGLLEVDGVTRGDGVDFEVDRLGGSFLADFLH
jgi:hypothetical protein